MDSPPWLDAWLPWASLLGWAGGTALDLDRANHLARERDCCSGSGRPIRFVASPSLAARHTVYERVVFDEGTVPTRTNGRGARHDFANALAWLAFPHLKSRLNALHVEALQATQGSGSRGSVRDRATLFDESGALVLTGDAGLAALVRGFRWEQLFLGRRRDWVGQIRVVVTGHALLEKLCSPYKAVCAQALIVDCAPDTPLGALDLRVASALGPGTLEQLTPLPLMGIPGWTPANHDPAFYNDPQVFRTGRQP